MSTVLSINVSIRGGFGRGGIPKPKPRSEDVRKEEKETFIGEVKEIIEHIEASNLQNKSRILSDLRYVLSRVECTCFRILRLEVKEILETSIPEKYWILELSGVMASWPTI